MLDTDSRKVQRIAWEERLIYVEVSTESDRLEFGDLKCFSWTHYTARNECA